MKEPEQSCYVQLSARSGQPSLICVWRDDWEMGN